MFRRLTWLFGASLLLVLPLGIAASAQAVEGTRVMFHSGHHRYVVELRAHRYAPWILYGSYRSPRHAQFVARDLRAQGLSARVVYG